MKDFFNIRKTLYYLITEYGWVPKYTPRHKVTVCQLVWNVPIGLLYAFGISVVFSMFSYYALLVPIAAIIYYISGNNYLGLTLELINGSLIVWGSVISVLALSFIVLELRNRYESRKYKIEVGEIAPKKNDNVIWLFYKSFKEKACFYIDLS